MAWFRRNSPAKEPSRWLAGVGALLLLVAGLSMTIAKWQSISSPMRLGGLVAIHLIVLVLAERLRPKLPDVARALVHLGSGLFAATGIQAVSTLGKAVGYEPMGGRWPLCCLVGGIAASITLEVQRRRWASRWMQGEMVLAIGLAGAGLSALSHVPVGIIAAFCAASAFSIRRNTESIALGSTALVCPFIGGLIIDWAPGTSRALGLVGDSLGWAAPIAGGVAAATLWLAAQARRSTDPTLGQTLRTAATIGLASNLLVAYSHSDIDLSVSAWAWIVWLSLAAVGTYRKNAMICALTSFVASAPLAIQLESLDAAPGTYALSFAGLSVMALATLIAARGSAFVSKIGYAGICGAAVALGLVADSFDSPNDLRIVGLSLMIAGLGTSLRGHFVNRKDIGSIGAGIGALGIVAELLSFPTDHAFDIWLPVAAAAAAVVEGALRAKDRINTRYPFVTSATTLSFYAIAGQLVHAGNVRVMIAVFVGLLLLTFGTLRSLNSVAVAGVATLVGSLGLAVGATAGHHAALGAVCDRWVRPLCPGRRIGTASNRESNRAGPRTPARNWCFPQVTFVLKFRTVEDGWCFQKTSRRRRQGAWLIAEVQRSTAVMSGEIRLNHGRVQCSDGHWTRPEREGSTPSDRIRRRSVARRSDPPWHPVAHRGTPRCREPRPPSMVRRAGVPTLEPCQLAFW